MQRACMGALMELAQEDERVLYLTADSGEGGLDRYFRMNFPGRSFEFGIAENTLVAAAAGLAMGGKVPFVFTAAPFLAYRSLEFIRNDICMQDLNVKLLAPGSGLSVGSLGPTHHTTEDIAMLRALPNLKILSPCSPNQVTACMWEAYRHEGPVYIRLGMDGETEPFPEGYGLTKGNDTIQQGKQVAIFCTGSILKEVQCAAALLEERAGVQATLVHVHTLKPFQGADLPEIAGGCPLFVSVEEHNAIGGLGSILAEEAALRGLPVKLVRIGLEDTFAKSYGSTEQVRKANGLDAESIYRRIREAL